jgi:hypothetical protein
MLASTADSAAKRAGEIGAVTTRVANRTSDWGQQTATRVVDRVSDAASRVAHSTRSATEAVANKLTPTTATTTDVGGPRSTGEPQRASVCEAAGANTDQQWRIGESIAPGNEEMQPQRRWEHARTVELNRERR